MQHRLFRLIISLGCLPLAHWNQIRLVCNEKQASIRADKKQLVAAPSLNEETATLHHWPASYSINSFHRARVIWLHLHSIAPTLSTPPPLLLLLCLLLPLPPPLPADLPQWQVPCITSQPSGLLSSIICSTDDGVGPLHLHFHFNNSPVSPLPPSQRPLPLKDLSNR